ncbi:SUN domain-containing protein 2-like [Hippoglossus hippoglossus]|uniref:SUN domain-containing protein 2-like n=1 Tax=Hippoglossus hippoglossus TaxID=8267 RepID=UPI00148B72DE|nr:SUN domain-containing protein 2-like [Hippoglossus hippoglossus]
MTEISRALMISPSLMAAKAKSMMHLGDLVNNSVSSRMKKTCGLLLLLFLIFLCVWLLFQPNTHHDAAEEIKEQINQDMQDLIRLISSLSDRIKAVEVKNEVVVKPSSPSAINNHLSPELQQAIEKWLSYHIKDAFMLDDKGSGRLMADKMADFALENQGARVIASRCSNTYRGSREFATLFGFTILTVTVSPRTVIQGRAPLLPGRCWSFPGAQGTFAITLSHPVRITHVTVDHLSRYNTPTGSINSAPKDFELYGMKDISEEGTLLGTFTYNKNGESTQTFQLPNPTDDLYHSVEMHVLSNWGQAEYTCLYRFRVHGKIAST